MGAAASTAKENKSKVSDGVTKQTTDQEAKLNLKEITKALGSANSREYKHEDRSGYYKLTLMRTPKGYDLSGTTSSYISGISEESTYSITIDKNGHVLSSSSCYYEETRMVGPDRMPWKEEARAVPNNDVNYFLRLFNKPAGKA